MSSQTLCERCKATQHAAREAPSCQVVLAIHLFMRLSLLELGRDFLEIKDGGISDIAMVL